MTTALSRRDFLKATGLVAVTLTASTPALRLLRPAQQEKNLQGGQEQYVPNICMMCPAACQILVRVKDGKVEKIEGNPKGPTNLGKICARGQAGVFRVYNPDRLKKPLVRDSPATRGSFQGLREASWDEALEAVASHLKKLISEGRVKEVFMLGGWPACLYLEPYMKAFANTIGTPNAIGTPGATCFFPKAFGWSTAIGVGAHSQILVDYENVKYLVVIRRNFFGSLSVVHGVRAGQKLGNYKLVVVDPRFSETAAKADLWIPIKPGTDLAFLLALINVVVSEGLYDSDFLRKFTNAPMLVAEDGSPLTAGIEGGKVKYLVWDLAQSKAVKHEEAILPALEGEFVVGGKKAKPVFQLLKEKVAQYTPEWAEGITGVPASLIRQVGIEFGKTRPAAVDTGWHDPKYKNSVMTWRAAAVLNALVGGLIKDGVLITGVGSIATPPPDVSEESVMRIWGTRQGVAMASKGFTYQGFLDAIEKGDPYKVSTLFLFSVNLALTAPDSSRWREALKKLDKVIAIDIYPIDAVLYADIVLPETTYLERDDPLYAMAYAPVLGFQTRVAAVQPLFDTRHLVDIIVGILKKLGAEYYEKYWLNLAKALGAKDPAALAPKLREAYEKEGVKGIRRVQAQARNLDVARLESEGLIVVKDSTALRSEMIQRAQAGQLLTPTGRVEVFSFALNAIKARMGYQPYWDPVVAWAEPEVFNKADGKQTFYLVYGRVPTMTHTSTADEPFLSVLTSDFKRMAWINRKVAESLGIKKGDRIRLVNVDTGKAVEAVAFPTDLVREDTVWVSSDFGHASEALRFTKFGVPYHVLTSIKADPVAGGVMSQEVVVRVEKV
ncbi:molybdopterin-dependent oxidoreductase [Infirmifilum lucidum]|uniref:Molybdopterin-dependent oxidoreductase n=1 Tax=Infirmifilum lucidum TaxID=2776706 RepID=A0A7L9FGL8_9CREN|nr:molybdopterin-dependent oxidoreductase [Infirmifilum lucidum]QOJ78857.1 molybdopterin-dependent oxidoreductase [Infirmifilum lucidum]